jgi:sugar lactone lactonase YvrE
LAFAVVAGTALIGVSPSSAATSSGSDIITTVVGGGGNPAITDGVASLAASLGSPLDAVFDASGNVVFADQNNNVIRVAAASTGTFYGHAMTAGHTYTIIGNGVAGYVGDGSNKALTTAELSGPNGVAIDGQGDIAITDSGNDAVRFVAASGGLRYGQEMTAGEIYTIAGGGEEGDITPGGSTFSAGLTAPDGVAFDAQGDVIVADTGNDLIRFIPAVARTVFNMAVVPGRIYTLAGNMNYGYTGDGGPGPAAQLQLDTFNGVTTDAKGDVVFSDVDNQAVRLIAAATGTSMGRAVTAGDIYTIAGSGPNNEGFKGNKKPATKAWIDTPQGVAIDASGNLFISDSNNNMVRMVPAAKGTYDGMAVKAGDIYTVAGNGGTGYSGNGVPATAAELNDPAGLAVGPSGHILISDNGNNVIRELTGSAPAVPTVNAIKPAAGPTSGDHKVSIIGANLSGTTAVMFGSRPALSFTVRSAKKIIAFSPTSTIGRVIVRVYSAGGVSVANAVDSYTYLTQSVKEHGRKR